MKLDDDELEALDQMSPEWLATSSDGEVQDDDIAFRVGRVGARHLIAEWVGTAKLIARRDASAHVLSFQPAASARLREKLTRGGAELLLRHLRGEIGLHGSAVARGGRAVAFVGGSGMGKSTLAAALTKRGAQLLSDDAVALAISEGAPVLALPMEATHWLDGESRTTLGLTSDSLHDVKGPVDASDPMRVAATVSAFIVLGWKDDSSAREMELRRLEGTAALAGLLPNLVRFAIDDPDLHRLELRRLELILAHTPILSLERRWDFALLGPTLDAIEAHLGENAG